MADDDRPAWRQGFDAIEAAVAPRLEELVKTEQFQVAMGLVTSAQKAVQQRAERNMRRALHLWNLPAGSDVTRILNEIGKLQRDVRELTRRLDASASGGKGGSDAGNGRTAGSPRTRAAGR
jgi:hypothetical protein